MKKLAFVGCSVAMFAAATPAYAEVVIGPRVAYYFDNSNLRTSSVEGGQSPEDGLVDEDSLNNVMAGFPGDVQFNSQRDGTGIVADQVAIPMIGAMINFGDDQDRFTFTAMYGDGSGSVSETTALSRSLQVGTDTANDTGSFVTQADFVYDRYDIELTWQRRTSEDFAFFAGVRYERLERSGPGRFDFGLTPNVDNLLNDRNADLMGQPRPTPIAAQPRVSSTFQQSASSETFSARAGVTAFVPFNDSSVFFFNGMIHASHQPAFDNSTTIFDVQGNALNTNTDEVRGETSAGPDFAVGAQFTLAENIALDVRYRAILFFPLNGEQSFSDARVSHGMNLGISFRL